MIQKMITNERHILNADLFTTGYGTHKYNVSFTGEWSDLDLITAVDKQLYNNPSEEQLKNYSHYGGNVKREKESNGVITAIVEVYYD